MIRADIKHKDGVYIVRISGHADFAPKGSDIVCAGVSALCMAFYNAVAEKGLRERAEKYRLAVEDGLFHMTIGRIADKNTVLRLESYIDMLLEGLRAIELKYPLNLSLSYDIDLLRSSHIDTSEQTKVEKERREVKGNGY